MKRGQKKSVKMLNGHRSSVLEGGGFSRNICTKKETIGTQENSRVFEKVAGGVYHTYGIPMPAVLPQELPNELSSPHCEISEAKPSTPYHDSLLTSTVRVKMARTARLCGVGGSIMMYCRLDRIWLCNFKKTISFKMRKLFGEQVSFVCVASHRLL